MLPPSSLQRAIERTVREEWGRLFAALVKSFGDFDLAEECLQEAILAAMGSWPENGLPDAPAAWLLTTARRKAIDRLRREVRFAEKRGEIAYLRDLEAGFAAEEDTAALPDKRLEMIFTCCHPALEEKTRIALTLRTLGGLSTEEIARAFLDKPDAMQQRLTRAKKKIAAAGIRYQIPEADVYADRLDAVLNVLYLIFNEGYFASAGDAITRPTLSDEAIRLARILRQLLPEETEVAGLLALMLLHDSRRATRTGPAGEIIALEHQNRARWDRAKIREGQAILHEILPKSRLGPYQLQAAISAVHAEAERWEVTDWRQISALYALLYDHHPTPVVRINQALALSHTVAHTGPPTGSLVEALAMLEDLSATPKIARYQPYHAARADILTRLGEVDAARASLETAITLSENEKQRAFLRAKIAALSLS